MNNSDVHINRLIAACLSDKITEKELEELNNWKNESLANKKQFDQYHTLWKKSKAIGLFSQIDSSSDWCKVKSRLSKNAPRIRTKSKLYYIKRIAAVILPTLLLSSTLLGLYWTTPGFGRWSSCKTENNSKEVLLPDSSIVILNNNSRIVYRNSFNELDNREITLRGEALFSVTKNPRKPFIVKTDSVSVSVLGTKFNVNDRGENVSISVLSGKVKVEDPNQNHIILDGGEKGAYAKGELTERKINTTNDIYWHTKKLEFKQSTLFEVCQSLQQAYPEIKTLNFIAEKSNIKITTSFYKQTLTEVIEELHLHFEKKISFNGKVLTISD